MRLHEGMISDNIECTWEICKTDSGDFPFVLIRSSTLTAPMQFHCRTLEEAHGKLNQLAEEYKRLGYEVDLG